MQILMVPLSENRLGLYPHEIPEVIHGLLLRRVIMAEERKEEEKVKIAFRTFYRLMFAEKSGRSEYLELSWLNAQEFVSIYKDEPREGLGRSAGCFFLFS